MAKLINTHLDFGSIALPINLPAPAASGDGARKGYVDSQVAMAMTCIPHLMPASGEVIETLLTASPGSMAASSMASESFRMYPYTFRAQTVISALQFRCSTAGSAGSLAKIGIYGSDANNRPDALIFEGTDQDTSVNGTKEQALSYTFALGATIWFGMRCNNVTTAPQVWSAQPGSTPNINGGSAIVQTTRQSVIRTIAYGTALPANWGWNSGEINNGNPHHLWLKVA